MEERPEELDELLESLGKFLAESDPEWAAEIASVKADPLMFVDYAYLESDTLTVDVEVGQPHE